ncbi:unnamed protein product [Camellia sinensis]
MSMAYTSTSSSNDGRLFENRGCKCDKKRPLRYQTHRKIQGGFTSSVQMASAITLRGGRLLANLAMHQISNGGLILIIGTMKMTEGMILKETMKLWTNWSEDWSGLRQM